MIHNSSSDPVLIKKISLKIWSLRDEIESRVQEKIDSGELGAEAMEEKIQELRAEYTKKSVLPDNILALKGENELNNDEDEMTKAMAAAEADSPEEIEADAESSESTDPLENVVPLNAATPAPADTNLITIKIEPPQNLAEDKIFKGKTILSEIAMEKMLFFSNKSYTEGQAIVIQFCIPKTFIINADVVYCRPFNIKSRIISQNNYTHRMLVRFNFLKEGERALLRDFIRSIEPDMQKPVKKLAAEDKDSDEPVFGELDDLGL